MTFSAIFIVDEASQWKMARLVAAHRKRGHVCEVLAMPTVPDDQNLWIDLEPEEVELVRGVRVHRIREHKQVRDFVSRGNQVFYFSKYKQVRKIVDLRPRPFCVFLPYSVFLDRNHTLQFPKEYLRKIGGVATPHGTAEVFGRHLPKKLGQKFWELGYLSSDFFLKSAPTEDVSNRKVRVLWSPHWSTGDTSFQISTFDSSKTGILGFARAHQSRFDWVLRPHPNLLRNESARVFIEEWDQLSNTSISLGNYTQLFRDVDLQILDSVSFLAEFSLTGRRSIFLRRSDKDYGQYFNPLGDAFLAMNSSRSLEGALANLENYAPESAQEMAVRQKEARHFLGPPRGYDSVAEAVIDKVLASQ